MTYDEKLSLIHYELAYYGDSADLESLIVHTIYKLPDEVQTFALERCKFLSIGKVNHGMVLPGRIGVDPHEKRSRNVWVILLHEDLPIDDAESIIAHEIAHAWLGHNRLEDNRGRPIETVATMLTAQWGFSGIGADMEFVKQRWGDDG